MRAEFVVPLAIKRRETRHSASGDRLCVNETLSSFPSSQFTLIFLRFRVFLRRRILKRIKWLFEIYKKWKFVVLIRELGILMLNLKFK